MNNITDRVEVEHPKYGKGNVIQFYEFYNVTFVDVLFEDYGEEPIYVRWDYLKIIKDEKNY